MKTKCKSTIRATCHSFGGAVCAGAVLLIASSAPAQNLFVSEDGSGDINEFTPGGGETTFASGLSEPFGLAFLSVPDVSSTLGLLVLGATPLFIRRRPIAWLMLNAHKCKPAPSPTDPSI